MKPQDISPELEAHYRQVAAEEFPHDEHKESLERVAFAAKALLNDVYWLLPNGTQRRSGPPSMRRCVELAEALAAVGMAQKQATLETCKTGHYPACGECYRSDCREGAEVTP